MGFAQVESKTAHTTNRVIKGLESCFVQISTTIKDNRKMI